MKERGLATPGRTVTGSSIEVAYTVPAELENDLLVGGGNHFCLGLSFRTEQWRYRCIHSAGSAEVLATGLAGRLCNAVRMCLCANLCF